MEKEIVKEKISLLKSLNYTQAYTGNLNQLVMKSYVEYSEVIKLINVFEKRLKELQNETIR